MANFNMQYYIIPLDRSKFTKQELEELEQYRQLAENLKKLTKMFLLKWKEAKTKAERREWEKCITLTDLIRCEYDDQLFQHFPQLPHEAVHVFY